MYLKKKKNVIIKLKDTQRSTDLFMLTLDGWPSGTFWWLICLNRRLS